MNTENTNKIMNTRAKNMMKINIKPIQFIVLPRKPAEEWFWWNVMKMVGVTSAALNRKDLESCQQFFRQHANPHKCSTTQRIRETQNLRQFYITCPVGIWLGCISKWLGWIPTVAQLRDSTSPPPPLTYFLHIKLSVPKRKKSHILTGFFWKTSLRDVKFQTYGRTYMCI